MLKQKLPLILLIGIAGVAIYLSQIVIRDRTPKPLPEGKYYAIEFENGRKLALEVADTDEKMRVGYMYREEIPEGTGMLFIYGNEATHAMWMKNMLLSLDIIWINKNMEIVSISRKVPPCKTTTCPSYPSQYPATYAIETRSGWTNLNKIYESMKVKIIREDGVQL